jgi:hypothetical protein
MDRHSTSWNDAWYSCEESESPNPDRGSGHWILYDLRHQYKLGQGKIWNINAPERLADGFNVFTVDYSLDLANWETLGDFVAAQGPGDPLYEGEEPFNFAGDSARYVLFTAETNYGGECFGFSEMRIDVIDLIEEAKGDEDGCLIVNAYPNPHQKNFSIDVSTYCEGPVMYRIFNAGGQLIKEENLPTDGMTGFQISTAGMRSGVYYLIVIQNGDSKQLPIVKIEN